LGIDPAYGLHAIHRAVEYLVTHHQIFNRRLFARLPMVMGVRGKDTQATCREFLAHGLGVDANQAGIPLSATARSADKGKSPRPVAIVRHLDQAGSRR